MKSSIVAVAMSGGVDSSLTAYLLKNQGYEVVGLTMRLGMGEFYQGDCCGLEGIEDARRVAGQIGIPHYVLNLEKEFRVKVVDYFCREYLRGRTPNPCILCNQELKFRVLMEKARALGARYIATGHYARVICDPEERGYRLLKARDGGKDQSYVLYFLNQGNLPYILFPLGEYRKEETRELARKIGLRVYNKKDSQEICFVAEGNYSKFLSRKMGLESKPGPIIDRSGKILGEHRGIYNYTIGQRRGIGIPAGKPLYVIDLDVEKNAVIVGEKEEVLGRRFLVSEMSWVREVPRREPLWAEVKIRYTHPGAPASLTVRGEEVEVEFIQPQEAITPGQAAVVYRGEEVLGGGWIRERLD